MCAIEPTTPVPPVSAASSESFPVPSSDSASAPSRYCAVVIGQRLAQPASDVFLGWVSGPRGRQFYVRQLRNAKIKPLIETFDVKRWSFLAKPAAVRWPASGFAISVISVC